MKFKVLDITTGHEVSADIIDKIAKEHGLLEFDIDQFSINEDGYLLLSDDTGKSAYVDMEKYHLMPVFKGKYPDLEYFEALFLGNIRRDHPEMFKNSFWMPTVELVDMFPQSWPNTGGGFAEPNMMYGQAFVTEITTVMKLRTYDTDEVYYAVFFGNKPAYIVSDADEKFLTDLKNHEIKSKYDAQEAY